MKKILFIIAGLNFSFAFPQCTITGADQIQVGERQVYQTLNNDAECENCYEWNYKDEKIILESDLQKNSLSLKGALPGDALLKLKIKTKSGFSTCEKLIKITVPTSNILSNDPVKCDLAIESFQEIRNADNSVTFAPETAEKNFTYRWTIYYRSGDTKNSTEKKPQFQYSNTHVIDKVEAEVTLNRCTKKLTKSYDNNFWYFF